MGDEGSCIKCGRQEMINLRYQIQTPTRRLLMEEGRPNSESRVLKRGQQV
jgi:hypothetical protein